MDYARKFDFGMKATLRSKPLALISLSFIRRS